MPEENNERRFLAAWRERLQALKNVPPVLKIVWDSGPSVVILGLICRIVVSAVPVGMGWVTGAIVGAVSELVSGKAKPTEQLWLLVGLELALAITGNLISRVIDYYDSVLAIAIPDT